MNKFTERDIYEEANQAGLNAVTELEKKHPDIKNQYPCGFAWIKIRPARGKFVTYLKENNIGRKIKRSYCGSLWQNSRNKKLCS